MATTSQYRARNRKRLDQDREGPAFIDDILAMAGSLASSRKQYAAAQIETLADSVRQFSETMPDVPTMRAYATTAADSLEELASYVVDSELADMVRDAREFTRRHPLATFGGSILAGLLVTQALQSRAAAYRSPNAGYRSRVTPPARSTRSGRGRSAKRGPGVRTSADEVPVAAD